MNEIEEQRVIVALRAIPGGLTVTEHDMIEASTRMQHNLKPAPPRRNPVLLAVAAAVVLIVGVLAFQAIGGDEKSAPPAKEPLTPAGTLKAALQADPYSLPADEFSAGTPPTSQTMAGLWTLQPVDPTTEDIFNRVLLYVDGGGRWRIGVPTEPLGFGTSTLAGDTWFRHLDERSNCGQKASSLEQPTTSVLAADGSLRVQHTDVNVDCSILDVREVWNRLAPGSPVMDYFQSVSNDIAWKPASGEWKEHRVFVAPETGHMLIVEPDGGYLYYDDLTAARLVAADEGDFEIDATQGSVTGTCRGGTFSGRVEVGQTPAVPGYAFERQAMRITSTEQGCGVAEDSVWVNVDVAGTGVPYQEPRT